MRAGLMLKMFAACVIVLLFASMASASTVGAGGVTLPFAGGQGTVTGYFQLDAAGQLTAWNFQVTPNYAFQTFTYTNTDPNQGALISGTDPSSILKPNKNGDQILMFYSGISNSFGLSELDLVIACGGVANCLSANGAANMSFALATGALGFACDPAIPGKCTQSGEQYSLNLGGRLLAGPAYLNVTGDPVFSLGTTADFTVWTPNGTPPDNPAVPEPATLLLMGTGVAAIAKKLVRR